MPRLDLTRGLSLKFQPSPERTALYRTPVVARLIGSGKWFQTGLFENMTQLVSMGGALAKLLELQEKVTAVATGRETEGSEVAGQLAGEVLRDLVLSGSDVDSLSLPPGIVLERNAADGSVTIRSDISHFRNWSISLTSGILDRCADLRRLDGELVRLMGGGVSFVHLTYLYVCPCGWGTRHQSNTCSLCTTPLNRTPSALSEPEPAVADLLNPAVWLELAVADCFELRGYRTVVGAKWTGLSGLEHELDVVAHLGGLFSVEVEATSGEVDMELVKRVLVRQREFPFQHFAIVSVGPAESHAEEFTRFHGIQVFANIRKNHDRLESWVEELKVRHVALARANLKPVHTGAATAVLHWETLEGREA